MLARRGKTPVRWHGARSVRMHSTVAIVCCGTWFVACSGSEHASSNSGGNSNVESGGSSPTAISGSAAVGGNSTSNTMNAIGGAPSTGGLSSTTITGGRNSIGGALTTGTSSATTGGTATSVGTLNTGGKTIGGATATGGSNPTGGTPAIGGAKPAGGAPATGGSRANGGTNAAGSASTDMCGRPTDITVPSGYSKLAWHDEFDADGTPNSANWGYETGFVRNNELQWYQAKNASVSGGLLHITAKRERVTNPNYNANGSDWKTTRQYADYTSASMTTSGKQSWKFGRFLMCGKIPISSGMWPAWWALGVSGEWPSNGEIDMMEFYKGKILANVAVGTSTRWSARWFSATKSVDATWAASYHLWQMDWDTNYIKLYVDDTLLNSVSLTDAINADGTTPFRQNAYMIVNLAIGGDNGGDPSNTTFPQDYSIDYIRVFQ